MVALPQYEDMIIGHVDYLPLQEFMEVTSYYERPREMHLVYDRSGRVHVIVANGTMFTEIKPQPSTIEGGE